MLGVCHVIFGKIFNVKVFTVTVNVTVTLVRALFQQMRNLRHFIFFSMKKIFFLVRPDLKKITKNLFLPGAGLDLVFLKCKNSAFNFPFQSEVRGECPYGNTV